MGGAVVMGWELNGALQRCARRIEDIAEFRAPAGLFLRRLLSADGVLDGRRRLGGLPVGPARGARRDRPGFPAADGAAGVDHGQARRARPGRAITR